MGDKAGVSAVDWPAMGPVTLPGRVRRWRAPPRLAPAIKAVSVAAGLAMPGESYAAMDGDGRLGVPGNESRPHPAAACHALPVCGMERAVLRDVKAPSGRHSSSVCWSCRGAVRGTAIALTFPAPTTSTLFTPFPVPYPPVAALTASWGQDPPHGDGRQVVQTVSPFALEYEFPQVTDT